MVATRNHPRDFDPLATESPTKTSSAEPTPKESPTKRNTRKSTSSTTSTADHMSPTRTSYLTQASNRLRTSASSPMTPQNVGWSHTPSNLTLIWLAISLPLVIWDTGYVVLRPYSMPGGSLHSPIWKPYALYGTVDHVYGFKAYEAHNGWTLAQGSLNGLETLAYFVYIYIVYEYGQPEERQGRGAPNRSVMGRLKSLSESRTVYGRMATWAVLLGYSTASLTFWKTVIYWLLEALSSMSTQTLSGLQMTMLTRSLFKASTTSDITIGSGSYSFGSFQSKFCYSSWPYQYNY